jgi:hypothetical protein
MARKETDKRITATVDIDLYDKFKYIADKKGVSVSDLLRDAIILKIRYENEDYYPLAKLEAERINQLVDHMSILSSNVKNLENLTIEGFSSLINLTRGDNYLFDEDEDV